MFKMKYADDKDFYHHIEANSFKYQKHGIFKLRKPAGKNFRLDKTNLSERVKNPRSNM